MLYQWTFESESIGASAGPQNAENDESGNRWRFNSRRTVSCKLRISRPVHVALLWCCTPIDSCWPALSNIFWVWVNAVKRSAANGRKLRWSRQMALRLPPFIVDLRVNLSSDRFATKRRIVEHSKGYRLVYQHFKFDDKQPHFLGCKERDFGVGMKSRTNSLEKFNYFL